MDDDVVPAHRVVDASREPLELPFQSLVLERGHPPAPIANGVVVVLAAGDDGLVARRALAELDPLDEAHLVKQVDGAIDARDPYVRAVLAKAVRDLLCREAAALAREQLDHRRPGAARPVPGLAQRATGGVRPVDLLGVRHAAENSD